MVELEGLEFQIQTSSEGAITHLKNLTEALTALRSASTNQRGLSNTVSKLRELSSAFTGVSDKFASLSNLSTAISSLSNAKVSPTLGKNIASLVSSAQGLDNATVERIERFSDAIGNLSGGGGRVSIPKLDIKPTEGVDTQTSTQAMATEQSVTGLGSAMEETSRSSVTFGERMRSAASSLAELFRSSNNAGQGLRTLARYTVGLPITLGSNLASRVRESVTSLGHLFSAIKRIALYRLIRTVIKEITQGLREGINNIYAYSNALGGEFASAMDSLASSSLYLKNSLGALAAPILQSLIPAINFAIDRLVALMNVINMFVAALGGKATATLAKKVETSFGGVGAAAGGAAGAAKKALDDLKTYTLGIDELNIIDPTDKHGSGGGGGGGGGGGINPADMFETVDIDSGISDFADKIRNAFNNHNWKELGTLLGGKFNEVVQGIKWEDLGKKVGTGIGGLISTARWTVETADFKTLGAKFAAFFNNATAEISWEDLGALLVDKVTLAVDAVLGFALNLETLELGRYFSDFLKGGFNRATEWIGNYQWDEIGTKLRQKITDFLKGIDWDGVWESLISFLKTLNHSVLEFVLALLGIDGQKTQNVWGKFFSNLISHDNVVVGKDGMLYHRQNVYSGGIFSKPEQNYIPLNKDELAQYGLTLSGSGGRGVTVPVTPVVQNNSKQWRKDLGKYWDNGVNNKPVTPFDTNLRDNSSVWLTDRNRWWDAGNRYPVSPFGTSLKDESGKWIQTRNTSWDSKNKTPVSPFSTNVKAEGSKWRRDVESEWNKNTPTLKSNADVNFNGASAWSKVKAAWDKNAGSLFAKIVMQVPIIQASINSAILQGGVSSIFKLQGYTTLWGAKGGILDKATLIGAGEAGKEALLPLDQNTEWMDTIATKVRDTISGYTMDTSGSVDRILARLEVIEAQLSEIGADAKRQADKPENTYVSIGGKTLRDAVNRQTAADGFKFA